MGSSSAASALVPLSRVLRRCAPAGMSSSLVLVLLAVVSVPGRRLGMVASSVGLDLSTLSRHAASLEERGLLVRGGDPADRRGLLLSPTMEGERVAAEVFERAAGMLEEAVSSWSGEDREVLFRLLPRLAADLG